MSKETTTVKILGASYKIACPPEESEEVKKAAIFLDNKLSEVKEASGLDEKRAAIITALNISDGGTALNFTVQGSNQQR